MDISQVTFPLYKLRSYIDIEKNPLGVVKIRTIKGEFILDDTSINEPFHIRRAHLRQHYPREQIYKLKEKIIYLRQLVKYKSGSTFIDYNGNIIKYTKSSALFEVKSHRIDRVKYHGKWSIIEVTNVDTPFIVGHTITPEINYASIMHSKWGPFLYDLTKLPHEPYKRKI